MMSEEQIRDEQDKEFYEAFKAYSFLAVMGGSVIVQTVYGMF